uniref:NADH-ubiquinone oxidoreductase chain 4 n=1 Tax=Mytilisepta keenae TaxID=2590091 RepID=A0A516EZC2_9BIVA|nr:NADH dehydrogenase subunit 4 [Mytilisepta keenae]QDO71856.1 NADH dehydrogenase subunit 4 [Mytilisepta keenae]
MVLGFLVSLVGLLVLKDVKASLVGFAVILFFSMILLGSSSMHYELLGIFNLDFLASSMICLTLYVVSLMVMMSLKVKRVSLMNFMNLSIGVVLVCVFTVSNFFFFFFFFESSLIPIVFMLIFWGYQPERLQAVNYMVIYMSAGSFPFLFGLSNLVSSGLSDSMSSMYNSVFKSCCWFYWFYLMGFFVKLPMFPFHLWLPKAHVEAPVVGSMILAGVLLKLGGYGIIRFLGCMMVPLFSGSFCVLVSVALFGGFLASVMCLMQVDLKSLVAYSSVGHMSLMVFALCQSEVSFYGCIILMVGHGLCSSGLFCLVYMFYCVSGSRSVILNKGFLFKIPAFVLCCFILGVSNMGAPPSLGFVGEVLLFMSCSMVSYWFVFVFCLMSFMSACYSLYLYGVSCHGKEDSLLYLSISLSFKDLFVLFLHIFPLVSLFLFL